MMIMRGKIIKKLIGFGEGESIKIWWWGHPWKLKKK